jgi:hypothetical protein
MLDVRLLCIETDEAEYKTWVNSDALSNVPGGPSALLRRILSHTEKLQYGGTRQENSVTDDPSIGGILNAQARGGGGEITGDKNKENFWKTRKKTPLFLQLLSKWNYA